MREAVELTGVILSHQPVGEFDKRLVILTREEGKITAFARGARRPKSAVLAATNPFVFAKFTLYEGRDAYTLASAEVAEYFDKLPQMIPGVWYGFYMLEMADYFGKWGLPSHDTVNLLFVAFRALLKGHMPPDLIRRVFEIRMLVINGEYAPPEEPEEMERSAYHALVHASLSPLSGLFSFDLSEQAKRDFCGAAETAVRKACDRPFKSLAVIEEMV